MLAIGQLFLPYADIVIAHFTELIVLVFVVFCSENV